MKSILTVALITSLSLSFLGSNAQSERQVKEALVAVYHQNQELTYKLILKDSVISGLDSLVKSKDIQLNSFERDINSFDRQITAFKKGQSLADSVITSQARKIQKQEKQIKIKGKLVSGLGLLSIILTLLLL